MTVCCQLYTPGLLTWNEKLFNSVQIMPLRPISLLTRVMVLKVLLQSTYSIQTYGVNKELQMLYNRLSETTLFIRLLISELSILGDITFMFLCDFTSRSEMLRPLV
ncbi:hypothetical protein ATANTOWER_025719 [Ataeniobius toweri]|uniref:Uncharacterized protein n=1 Tax=Ataeniobius toweri TaxID=208326 RepID=A0ABU7B8X1_9TELE|nr:hypothetical protein [Ataeniobius toweri]